MKGQTKMAEALPQRFFVLINRPDRSLLGIARQASLPSPLGSREKYLYLQKAVFDPLTRLPLFWNSTGGQRRRGQKDSVAVSRTVQLHDDS